MPATSLGLACLGRVVFEGQRLNEVWEGLANRFRADPTDFGALLDLSTLLLMTNERERGLELQAGALSQEPCYRTIHGSGRGLKILAFAAPGDLMTNTPIDFLLEGSDVELITWFVGDGLPDPSQVPEHDVAFLAVSQSDKAEGMLQALQGAFDGWPRPVINGRPERIAALTRDGVAARFAGHPQVICPATQRAGRAALQAVATGVQALTELHEGLRYPVIVRPTDSHAGGGLEKLDGADALAAYLAEHGEAEFFIASYFDYAGADGLFRKLRVVFADGRPFISHMAVSARWMVHYLNADMSEAANRAEEAQMMATFDEGFAARHCEAFQALHDTLGLDYFGIDCAETQDGRLLVFETDVAMIVHAMDSTESHPYKQPAMAKLFAGFIAALTERAQAGRLAA
ncbi:MAG TPA: hypothetical protein VIE16_07720 [Phenylobacterium sp.]|jgi:hypothetical protein